MTLLNRCRPVVGATLRSGLGLTLGAALALLTTCGPPAERPDCFKPAGRTGHEYRRLPPFSTIEVFDNVQVVLAADGQPFGVDLTAGRNLLSELNTDVRPTEVPGRYKLVIANANRCNWVRDQTRPLTVTVHLPDSAVRRSVTVLHRGEELVRTATPGTRLDSIFVLATNIGDTELDLVSEYVWLGTYEYGDIRLRGRARDLRCTASGVGHLRAEALDCRFAYVKSYRDGEVHVRATEGLGIELFGNANGYWYGQPAFQDNRAHGKGQVRRGGD